MLAQILVCFLANVLRKTVHQMVKAAGLVHNLIDMTINNIPLPLAFLTARLDLPEWSLNPPFQTSMRGGFLSEVVRLTEYVALCTSAVPIAGKQSAWMA